MEIRDPIMIVCAGRSGSTMYSRVIARHREVGWLSSWNQALPAAPCVAFFSRLYGARVFDRVKHAYWFPKPFAAYRFWERSLPGVTRPGRPLTAEDVPAEAIEPLRRRVERVLWWQGKRRFLIKVTGWARMAFFQRVFPDLRFIDLQRRPISVVASWLKAGWLDVTNDIDGPGWAWGPVPQRYRRVYRELGGGPVLSAAVKTQLDVDDIRRNVALFPGRCLEVRYEDLVKDPVHWFRETLRFCELEWTPAFERVVHGTGIRDYSDRWKDQLAPGDARLIAEFFERIEAERTACTAAAGVRS
jgi:hypothetical protein